MSTFAKRLLFGGKKREENRLTVILPTHNRPRHCAAQLRFFKDCGLRHDIVVADSSNQEEAEAVRAACVGVADYRRFDPQAHDKLLTTIRSAGTPFVVMTPDDDITFPHAIDAALDYLTRNSDYVVAHGYTLRFGLNASDFDIHSVYTFAPSIDHDDPLARHYHLMRRYQPFFWAVFRRDILELALEVAQPFVTGAIFQELLLMNAAVFRGKIAMLPMVYAMRGMEESQTPVTSSHPLFAVLDNAERFFSGYLSYRNALANFMRGRDGVPGARRFINPVSGLADSRLEQLIDIVHATWLGREANVGVFNHAARLLLGEAISLLAGGPVWPGSRALADGDVVHSGLGDRRYIWRRTVLEAEPREEIIISAAEIARVEEQLEAYRLGQTAQ